MLVSWKVSATHIVGGEISYVQNPNNEYVVTLEIYRDCSNPNNANFDDPANLMIYRSDGTNYTNVFMNIAVRNFMPSTINNPCITTPQLCVEYAMYTTTLTLPPIFGGYNLVYQRCCRNGTILNLIQPGSIGSTYMEHVPGTNEVAFNSSPKFNSIPPKFICKGIRIEYDHAATDPDGHSLVYSLCDPFNGLDACCPILASGNAGNPGTFCPSPPSSCPTIGQPPPYQTVPFQSPYSGGYPLSSNPAISIDPHTGFLDGIPDIIGQWVVGVCVQEYRNGVLIGTHKRDFQFNVVQCTVASSAAIANQTIYCEGFQVDFHNLSFSNIAGGVTYSWAFGDTTTLADTSHLFEPSYVYPDTGRYSVELIVNEGKPCADSTTIDFYIYPELDPDFTFTYSSACINDNSFDFVGGGVFAPYATFDWNFGPNANPVTSTNLTQNNVEFTGNGPFPVTFTVKQAICSKGTTQTILVYPEPQAYFSPFLIDGCQPQTVQFTDSSIAQSNLTYLWIFGDGDSSTLENPIHVYEDLGTYNVTLMVKSSDECVDSSVFTVQNMVVVKPSPRAGFIVYPFETTVYDPVFHFIDTSFQTVAVEMQMGDGLVYNYFPEQHFYEEYGEYEITQVAFGSNGCPDTMKQKVRVIPEYLFWIPNAFTPNGDYINGTFKPEVMGVTDYVFYVYDRWGEKIFETTDQKAGWDGTYKGHKCQQDVYIYLIRYMDIVDEDEYQKTGTFTLFR